MSKEQDQGLVLSEEDILWSKLKLAILKENFEYQEFFREFKKHETKKYRSFPLETFNKFGLTGFRYSIGHPRYNDCIKLLDPTQEIAGLKPAWVDSVLPYLFYSPAVVNVEVDGQPFNAHFGGLLRGVGSMHFPSMMRKGGIKPFERIFKVDLKEKSTAFERV